MYPIESISLKISSSQREYHCLCAGPTDGPLVILLHGWPAVALTWRDQVLLLASFGFRAVAPDMPGYGQTWTSDDASDFSLEKLVPQFLELVAVLGNSKAVWIGHDWGCAVVWAIAAHHPEVCSAVVAMSVPYRTLELGLKTLLPTIDRRLYPEKEYPYGQWDYQNFYQQSPESVDRQFESDLTKYLKMLFSKGAKDGETAVAITANVTKERGWFRNIEAELPDIPLEATTLDQAQFEALAEGFRNNGFHGATSWYLNHDANEKYGLADTPNAGILKMPVLFIHTRYDSVCATLQNPKLTLPMRTHCQVLQETVIDAGHWGMLEQPTDTNAAIVLWLAQKVQVHWPGPKITNTTQPPQ